MKILITIDWFLPGTLSGGPVRSYANLIEHLKDDFEFFVITRNTDYGSNQPYENIKPDTWVDFNVYTKIYYISPAKLNKTHLKEVINAVNFDVAYINGIYSWYFSILPIQLLKKKKKPIIISARGMLNPQAFSVKGTKKKVYLKIAKLIGVYKGVSFHATNTDEANCIKNEITKFTNVSVAPNLPRKKNALPQTNIVKQNPVRFVNVARIAVEKGTLKMLEALRDIKNDLHLDLYGPIYDKNYWNKCKTVISTLPNTISVNYKGVLSSDAVPQALRAYDFFVLLSEGENFGHSILEALSAGCPVLISNNTPWKDLKSQHLGWDVKVEEQSQIKLAFDEALHMSQDEYKKWSQASFNYAQHFINNPDVLEQNKDLFLNVLKKQ